MCVLLNRLVPTNTNAHIPNGRDTCFGPDRTKKRCLFVNFHTRKRYRDISIRSVRPENVTYENPPVHVEQTDPSYNPVDEPVTDPSMVLCPGPSDAAAKL